MGKTDITMADPEEIIRKKTAEFKNNDLFAEEELVEIKDQPAAGADKIKKADQKANGIRRSNSVRINQKLDLLKTSAGMMPHHIPSRPLTKKEKEEQEKALRRRTTADLENIQRTLENEEISVFGKNGIKDVKRTRFSSLSNRDKKKRVDAAIQRKANAARLDEMEEDITGLFRTCDILDKASFEKELRGFMMLTERPFKMDKDDSFVRNLKRNYELCETAWRMKKWVSDAVEGGYFPESYDLAEVQAKIMRFMDLKDYLDTQKELMKNPYYQYIAKKDISYNDDQIDTLKKKTGNETLRNYLATVQKLRGLSYVRKKDMSSVMDRSVKEGKRQAEILKSRVEKRQLIRTFSSEALELKGIRRLRDKDYDARFTPQLFEAALRNFRNVNVKDLHFKDIRDIAEHFQDNARLFEESREVEHLLLVAIQRDLAPADNVMIELRSKIKAFRNAEYMMNQIQLRVLRQPDRFTNEQTYAEFLEKCRRDLKIGAASYEAYDMPVPGKNMDTYYKSVLTAVKREHRDRKDEIRKVYGITHPVKREEDGNVTYRLGVISPQELETRSAEYQKNVFVNEYIDDLEKFTALGHCTRVEAFTEVYGKIRGKKIRSVFGRVATRYVHGMSAKELKEFIDIEEFGTDEEREKLWMKVFKEGSSLNLEETDSDDPKVLLHNMAYKTRIAGMQANFGSNNSPFARRIRDKEVNDMAEVIYDVGCTHSQKYAVLAQMMDFKMIRSLSLRDIHSFDSALVEEFSSNASQEDGPNGQLRLRADGRYLTETTKQTQAFAPSLSRPNFLKTAKKSQHNPQRSAGGYFNTPSISMYETKKHLGVIKDTTGEELGEIREFYRANIDRKEKKEGILRGMSKPQEKATTIEDEFKQIMSFDLALFNYKSYKDIVDSAATDKERFKKCRDIVRVGREAMNHLPVYEQCRRLGAECLLNEKHINELKARIMVLSQVEPFFGERFLNVLESPALERTGMSLDEIMHLSQQETIEKRDASRNAKDPEAVRLWSTVWDINESLNGFDMGMDLNVFLPAMRYKFKCYGEPMDKEILNLLNRKASVIEGAPVGNIQAEREEAGVFLGRFAKICSEKDLTVTERERKLEHPDSRLRAKRVNAETLKNGREEVQNARIAARRKISIETRMAAGEENLIHLSAFMSGDQKADEDMLKEYAGKDTRFGLLDKLTRKIVGISFDLNISNDTNFAASARRLEEISSMARAYDALIKENPDYLERLKTRRPGNELSDLAYVKMRLDTLLSLSDLYRARSVLMTDPYYISHYDDELSADRSDKSTEEESHVADMIRLTAECIRRVEGERLAGRSDVDMDTILERMEQRSQRRAYLTGKSDLKKADISYTKKADQEIAAYYRKIVETNDDIEFFEIKKRIGESKEEHPFPQLVKYETEAVKNHISMIRTSVRFSDAKLKSTLLDDKQKSLWNKLSPMLAKMKRFEFIDPVTKDKLSFKTDPQRIINGLVFAYGKDLPEEEILEIIEGFNVINENKLDENDPKILAYAKQRWLDSSRKLFYLEYNAVKRFESTYGTLPDQLPPGSFMHSLGRSKGEYFKRIVFGPDVEEFTEEKHCKIGENSMSIGEYLKKEGMIKEDELNDAINLNGNFYLQVNTMYQQVHSQAVAVFGDEDDSSKEYDQDLITLAEQLDTRRHYAIKGPKISQDKERKYWKDAFEEGESSLYGNQVAKVFRQDHLNTYSSSELADMKERRKNESGLIKFYEETVNERAEVLSDHIKELAGDGVSGELIDRLIYFHPHILTETGASQIPEKDHEDFITFVKSFAGIGVPEAERGQRKKEAYRRMTALMSEKIGPVFGVNRGEELIEDQTYEDRNEKVHYASKLMRTTLLERISDSIQYLMKEEKDKSVIEEDTYRRFRQDQVKALPNIILKNLKTKKRYLELKDLGNREITVPDIELAEIDRLLIDLTVKDYSLDGSFRDYRKGLIKKLYGIDIASTSEIMGLEEEKPKEEEIKEQSKDEIKEQPKEEIKEQPKAVEKEVQEPEENINVINLPKEEETVPKVKLPDLPKYYQDIKMTTKEYEKQGYSNCWCVAGAALFNRFMGKKLVNQYDMRAFSPSDKEIKTYAEIDRMGQGISKAEYNEIVADYRKYMGKNCVDFGSIYQTADFFLKLNPDMAVRRMVIAVPSFMNKEEKPDPFHKNKVIKTFVPKTEKEKQDDLILYHGQKEVFIRQVNDILATGNPVAILDTGRKHFKTITKIDGDWITLLDSQGNIEERERIEDVLRRDDDSNLIELTWLSKLKDPKDEMQEQPNLTYSDAEGYSLREPTSENARNPMWVDGVSASKDDNELHIMRSSYLPIKKKVTEGSRQKKVSRKAQEKSLQQNDIKQQKDSRQAKQTVRNSILSGQTEAVPVIKQAEKQGCLKIIDGLFEEKSRLGTDFCRDYSAYLNEVMDSDDFSFDEKGIAQLRDKVRESVEKREAKSKFPVPVIVEHELERFDTLMVPTLNKVFKLVQDKVVGKDTARIFLNPVAMANTITAKDFESGLYRSLTVRSKYKESDAKSELKYREEVKELVKNLHGHTEGIKIQDKDGFVLSYKDMLRSGEVMKRNGFVYFAEKVKEGASQEWPDVRCYVTVKEKDQKKMVSKLRELMNERKEFKGAFDFKLLSTSNGHKLDNIVIYLSSKRVDPKLFKEFIDSYSERIKDIAYDDESIPTVRKIKKGIGISTEPDEVYHHLYKLATTFETDLPESLKKGVKTFPYDKKLVNSSLENEAEKGRMRMSWNEYCARLLILSSYIARHRLGRTDKDTSVSKDEEVKKEMDKVYQEFMILSGINPSTMMPESNGQFFKTMTGK